MFLRLTIRLNIEKKLEFHTKFDNITLWFIYQSYLLDVSVFWKLPGYATAILSLLSQVSFHQAVLFVGVRAASFSFRQLQKVLSCVYLFQGAHFISASAMTREGFQSVDEDPCFLSIVSVCVFHIEVPRAIVFVVLVV